MDYPTHDEYARLYARYLKPERTEQLLALIAPVEHARVLDLCGGGGRASQAALAGNAAHVTLVDESRDMTAHLGSTPRLEVVHGRVQPWLRAAPRARWDAVICQQAVNYWLTAQSAADVAAVLRTGGRFVFNTFSEAPGTFPVPKQYEWAGQRFLELSWRVSATRIQHVQVCDGQPVHVTAFEWISPEQFRQWLEPWFECECQTEAKTAIYRCTRR